MHNNSKVSLIASFTIIASITFADAPSNYYDPADPKFTIIKPQDIKWKQLPNMPKGADFSLLEGKLDLDHPFTIRISLPPNTRMIPHYHVTVEHIVVLSGVLYTNSGENFTTKNGQRMPAGSYAVYPPKFNHFVWTGKEGAVFQVNGYGISSREYINPSKNK
ncbi:MAG: cupin domain-containing protein [Legionellaceae bacterium]|nr:cupin domain-containing protein [Legionellaceae bacterium]